MKRRFISSILFCGSLLPVVGLASTDSRLANLERLADAQSELIYQMRQDLSAAFREIADLRGQLEYNTHQLNQTIERQKSLLLAKSGSHDETTSEQGTATWQPSGDDEKDYQYLLDLALKQQDYKNATAGFQSFIKAYPQSPYLANATYWAGQLLYNQKNYDEASFYFASVVKNHPRSDKTAESMYKIGRILENKGDEERAQSIYLEVLRQYPDAAITKEVEERIKLR